MTALDKLDIGAIQLVNIEVMVEIMKEVGY